jgi:DNA-binding SARP family transcriptional activator
LDASIRDGTARRMAPEEGRGRPGPELTLLGGFGLRGPGGVVELPLGARRLIAFLAVNDRPQPRAHVAGTLWPDVADDHAAASLRSTLWRFRRAGLAVIVSTWDQVRLAPGLLVDLHEAVALARRLRDPAVAGLTLSGAADSLGGDLLPGWYDDWVVMERERFRQIRLHALERLAQLLAESGRAAEAIEAGLMATAGEPLRESAHRALIAAHLMEGNASEAVRQFELYRRLLRRELSVEPSPEMMKLIAGLTAGPNPARP